MVVMLPPKSLYRIHDPKNFYAAMRDDVRLLLSKRAYISLCTIIMCCIDALAATSGEANRDDFETFVKKHFPDLCTALESICSGQRGPKILYEEFRNGFTHLRGPKSNYAIAEARELREQWAAKVKVGSAELIAINIDRLAREFLEILDDIER